MFKDINLFAAEEYVEWLIVVGQLEGNTMKKKI